MNRDIEQRIQEIWGEPDPAPPPICAPARQFQQWAEALCTSIYAEVQRDNTRGAIAVNQGKVLLIDKLHEWRATAPKDHRNRVGRGHTCLLDIFDQTYRALRAIELSLTPPLLFLPPSPAMRVPKTLSIADVVSFLPGADE
jgi:hypothetical protein